MLRFECNVKALANCLQCASNCGESIHDHTLAWRELSVLFLIAWFKAETFQKSFFSFHSIICRLNYFHFRKLWEFFHNKNSRKKSCFRMLCFLPKISFGTEEWSGGYKACFLREKLPSHFLVMNPLTCFIPTWPSHLTRAILVSFWMKSYSHIIVIYVHVCVYNGAPSIVWGVLEIRGFDNDFRNLEKRTHSLN